MDTGSYYSLSDALAGSFVIEQQDLTVTATGVSKIYDDNTSATVVLGSEDIVSADDVTLSYTSAFFADAEVGADKGVSVSGISLGGTDAPNYNLLNETAETTASISPEAASISLEGDLSVTYDSNEHPLTATTDPEELDYVILYNGVTTALTDAGEYAVFAIITDPNYAGTDTATLVINQAEITVTADAKSKTYGEADPELNYEVTSEQQLMGDDALSGSLSREVGEDVGEYDITQGTLDNENYDITYNGATFTINKVDQAIDFGELGDKVIGDPDFDLSATASSGLSVDYSVGESSTCELTGEAGNTVRLLGVGTCTIIASQEGNGDYNEAENISQSFTIAELVHTIDASSGTGGSISPSGEVTVADGDSQVFTITASSGFEISNVVVDEVSVGAVNTYTFSEIVGDHSILASFKGLPSGGSSSWNRVKSGTTSPIVGVSSDDGETSPISEVLGAEKFIFTLDLKKGPPYPEALADEVTELQKLLKSLGYYIGLIDGKFGPWTEDAVRAYQFAHPPLKIDGIVGLETRAVLNK